MAIRRPFAVCTGLTALGLAIAGCSSSPATNTGAATTTAPTTAGAVTTPATAAAGTTPTPSAADTSTAPVNDTSLGCPVSVATLLTALKRNTKIYANLAPPVGLEQPTCYHGYATAQTKPVPNLDPATVVFAYKASTHTWSAVNFGSSGFCTGKVPADVIAHLPQCVG